MISKFSKIRKNWYDLTWWDEVVLPYLGRQVPEPVLNSVARAYYFSKSDKFVSIPDADWDNLLILDACRYDIFDDVHDLNGELKLRYSKGPQSPVFLEENFGERDFHDIVYVTANPYQKKKLNDDQFHRVYHVWKSGWDDELKTVHPEVMNEVSQEAYEKYPNKRIIVHYMQPHMPFIGPWAREHIGIESGNEHERDRTLYGDFDEKLDNPYRKLRRGDIDKEDVLKGYIENLEVVLEFAGQLIEEFEGKSVVTSDHGEMFGERAWPYPWKLYQHDPPYMAEKLLQVPWLTTMNGERRTIESEPPSQNAEATEDRSVEKRLEHLGYR